jgi:phosphate transport system permease protein
VPLVLYLHAYLGRSRVADWLRLTLDIMWGIPSIVYGAFGFALMIFLGLRASLLAGIIALSFVVLPILARTFDEVLTHGAAPAPRDRLCAGHDAAGDGRAAAAPVAPRSLTAILLAFGRGIGDAAAVLFTAGYTDNMPTSILAAGGLAAAGRLLSSWARPSRPCRRVPMPRRWCSRSSSWRSA